jgi:hypothetical protein
VAAGLAVDLGEERPALVVLVSPFTSITDMARPVAGWLTPLAVRDRFDTAGRLPRISAPLVIVHGTHDEVIPFAMGEELARSRPGSGFVAIPVAPTTTSARARRHPPRGDRKGSGSLGNRKGTTVKIQIRISSVSGLVVLGAICAQPALSQFEGVAEMKTTMEAGRVTATSKMFLGKPGYRMEMKLSGADMQKAGMGGMTMATLVKSADPNKVYQINDSARTHGVMDLSKMKRAGRKGRRRPTRPTRSRSSAEDNVNGFACDNARVTA